MGRYPFAGIDTTWISVRLWPQIVVTYIKVVHKIKLACMQFLQCNCCLSCASQGYNDWLLQLKFDVITLSFQFALSCTELVLKVMDAGYCLYVHIFMKNINSLKPFNFYNSNQLTPDCECTASVARSWTAVVVHERCVSINCACQDIVLCTSLGRFLFRGW